MAQAWAQLSKNLVQLSEKLRRAINHFHVARVLWRHIRPYGTQNHVVTNTYVINLNVDTMQAHVCGDIPSVH